jgi:phosphoenolpyruvate carboxykinase (ATP)
MPRPPAVYGNLLRKLIAEHDVDCWLINTGWTGGIYGTGQRMPINVTRSLLTAALDGSLRNAEFYVDPNFGFEVPKYAGAVDPTLLNPRSTWKKPEEYDRVARRLAEMFQGNFERFASLVDESVRAAGPPLKGAAARTAATSS